MRSPGRPAVTDAVAFEKTAVLAVLAWRFKPFVLAGQPVPVCSLARLAYPVGATLGETVLLPPPMSPDKRPLVFATAHLGSNVGGAVGSPPSRDVRDAARFEGKSSLVARFRICVDDAGHVESVLLLRSTGYASYDRSLMRAMRTRMYRPYEVDGKHVPAWPTRASSGS